MIGPQTGQAGRCQRRNLTCAKRSDLILGESADLRCRQPRNLCRCQSGYRSAFKGRDLRWFESCELTGGQCGKLLPGQSGKHGSAASCQGAGSKRGDLIRIEAGDLFLRKAGEDRGRKSADTGCRHGSDLIFGEGGGLLSCQGTCLPCREGLYLMRAEAGDCTWRHA